MAGHKLGAILTMITRELKDVVFANPDIVKVVSASSWSTVENKALPIQP